LSIRRPCQAGSFYSSTGPSLRKEIEECFLNKLGPGKIPKISNNAISSLTGLVVPHAGYMFSGTIAAHSYFTLAMEGSPDCAILIGPNHTGLGSGISIMDKGIWVTPFGEITIDSEIANQIYKNYNLIDVDEKAHLYEHSIEVQIPFLQYLYGEKLLFVPICMMMQDLETSIELGEAIAKSINNKNAIVIASSDMTHYESSQLANKKDKKAIDAILKLNEVELFKIIESERISMCGYGPVISVIACAKKLGASKAKLLSYKTSGDITGDHSSVVGYASLIFTK
jgi:AmmeMemoRadiSam system protein B